jgi:hypothetical protein
MSKELTEKKSRRHDLLPRFPLLSQNRLSGTTSQTTLKPRRNQRVLAGYSADSDQ